MKAAVLHEAGTPMRLEDLDLDNPMAGEVLVRVEAAGVCHSDYHYMIGDLATPLPVVLGHEGAGIVEAVGSGVTTVQPEDRVVLLWRPSCGRCAHCAAGRPALCDISKVQRATGGMLDGTSRLRLGDTDVRHFLGVSCFAERCIIAEQAVIKVAEDTPLQIAALLGCSVLTGVGAVLNTAQVRPGSTVMIIGAGGVGLCCLLGAVVAGAAQIVMVDVESHKLALSLELGATDVIDGREEDPVKAVRRLTGGGVNYAFEAIGRPETLRQAVRSVRAGGTAVAVGIGREGATFDLSINELVLQEKTVKGSLYGSARPVIDIPLLLELYQRGRLPLDRLLIRRYPLAEVNQAYAALVGGEVGRSIIVPSS